MNKALIFFFMIFLQTNVSAQNVKIVEYYFTKDSMVGLLPYDQHFVIKVLEVNDLSNLSLKIYEIKKYDYKKLLEEMGNTETSELSFESIERNKHSIIFTSKIFTKTEDFRDGFCKINVNAYLQPNSRYIIAIDGQKQTPIDNDQKNILKAAIKQSADIQKLIADEISQTIIGSKAVSADNWDDLTLNLSKKANEIINAINANYLIRTDINYPSQLKKISKVFINNINILNKLNDVTERYREYVSANLQTEQLKKETDRVMVDSTQFVRLLANTDFISLGDDDVNYNTLIRALDRIFNLSLISDDEKKDKLKSGTASIAEKLKQIILAKNELINEFIEIKLNSIYFGSPAASTYSPDFIERAKQHVTFDLGYAYVWGIDKGNAYASMNIYFRGVDTSLPLKNYRANLKDYLGSHFSLLIGISVESIQKDSVRRGLLGNGSALITGIGYKLLPWFKINSGAYLYYKYPTNPLYKKDRLTFTGSPFISLSIDINLASLFNSISNGNIFKQL